MYLSINTYINIYVYPYLDIWFSTYTCIFYRNSIYVFMRVFTYTHMYIYSHIYIYTKIYIYIYAYIHVSPTRAAVVLNLKAFLDPLSGRAKTNGSYYRLLSVCYGLLRGFQKALIQEYT